MIFLSIKGPLDFIKYVVFIMKTIGIVASHATESRVTVILNEGMEKEVESESLVLVENRNGGKILAVCRSGIGVNNVLRATTYSPGVAYAKTGR